MGKYKLGARALNIVLIIIMFLITIPSSVLAQSDNNDGTGWLLFWITLGALIVIVALWIVTYFIMRGVVKRLEGERDKVRRYESRKDADKDHSYREEDRERQRRKRVPTGDCLVCNRKFIPGADAYQCECGKFIHVHCLSDIPMCPHCGRDIEKDVGVVRIEDTGRRRGGGDHAGRKKVNRLMKAKFCPVCNKIIKAGDSAMQCDCGATFHLKCSNKAKRCPKCGN
jgi:hypothetical protein